jgi:ABC-type transporter Mla subunit MlaD
MRREGYPPAVLAVGLLLVLFVVLFVVVLLVKGPSRDRERTAEQVVSSAGAHRPVVTPVRRP